jgi:oligogalacturonide lyase
MKTPIAQKLAECFVPQSAATRRSAVATQSAVARFVRGGTVARTRRSAVPSLAPAFLAIALLLLLALPRSASAQIGRRFPSEKKIVVDSVTGVPLSFLTSGEGGDSKIYQTHHQWTSDGQWLVFRSNRVPGQAMAVNEATGDLVQVTAAGYSGMLCLATHSMNLYFLRIVTLPGEAVLPPPDVATIASAGTPRTDGPGSGVAGASTAPAARGGTRGGGGRGGPRGPSQIIRVDLAKLFADSAAGKLQGASAYEKICGTVPPEFGAVGDVALDPTEDFVYLRVGSKELAAQHLAPDTKAAPTFGPRSMGAGPTGLASMNLKTGETKFIVAVPFQIGHVQTNPWVPGEIIFCWETGGKAPQRTWTVLADGTGLRPLWPEAAYDWVTHEAVITKDEVAFAVMGHRKPGVNDDWGISGTREHPTGLGIVNLRTREMRFAGQTKSGSGLWHVHGSPDGRWAVGDDFERNIYLIDRRSDEMVLLSSDHKRTAADHPHPTFSTDSTRIQIQSAKLSADGRAMNICIIPVPEKLLQRTYSTKLN